MQTIGGVLQRGHQVLREVTDSYRLDAELLLAYVLGQTRTFLRTYPERSLLLVQAEQYQALCARRARGEPIAYLLGTAFFLGREFNVNGSTLVPRPETEELVEHVLASMDEGERRVIDLGTGSGVIAISLALARPAWHVLAVDISASALAVARDNAQRLRARSITWLHQDGLVDLAGVDLIVANPPYIAEGDRHLLGDGVCCEPKQALLAGADGLEFIRRMVEEAAVVLKPGGWLFFEHGYDQGEAVVELLLSYGFVSVRDGCDVGGRERFASGCWLGVNRDGDVLRVDRSDVQCANRGDYQ